MKLIQEAIRHIYELKNSLIDLEDEFMDEFCPIDFLSKKEMDSINSLSKIPSSKWSNENFCRAFLILENNKKNLLDIDINFKLIRKPDFSDYGIKSKCSLIKINTPRSFEVCISLFNESFTDLEINSQSFIIKINLNNIYGLFLLRESRRLYMSKEILALINIYLNNINHDDEICSLIKIDSYNKTPMPFQNTGILFALLNKKVLIADEMGLGKSIIALSTIQRANAFKCVIVCPKSLKYKWHKEALDLTNRKVEIISSKTNFDKMDKDIYIINYDNIKRYTDVLEASTEIKSIIFDESHYLKNAKTQRSKSCLRISKGKEFILELTGSPVLNKPSELINQIEILDKLNDFGGYNDFISKYCFEEFFNRSKNSLVEYKEPNYTELAENLRSTLYIRREKKDILRDLPPKQKTTILVDINRSEYNKNLKIYKAEKDNKNKKQLLENLKSVAARGKFDSIIERIDNCIENQEKVVVFAYHIEMQKKLIEHYPSSLRIVSEQSEHQRFENAENFQSIDSEFLIICSIKVAYYGFDLFSASQAIFAEMDWVPEINNQAEDRLHRIGQLNHVNIWYIIAKDTIEEKILKVNRDKAKIIKKINMSVSQSDITINNKNTKDAVMKLLDFDDKR